MRWRPCERQSKRRLRAFDGRARAQLELQRLERLGADGTAVGELTERPPAARYPDLERQRRPA
jgi:hypothetical protein